MVQNYIDNLDIYEVEKSYYSSYEYRCKDRQLMKLTPNENLIVWKDIETGLILYGKETHDIMGTKATRFFVFELLKEELLGPEKTIQKIEVDEETYKKFIEAVTSKKEN